MDGAPARPADRGLWITWHDLDAGSAEAYLAWLHGAYLPRLLEQPGVLHAAHYVTVPPAARHPRATTDPSVPTGHAHLLVVGARSPHAFSRRARHYAEGRPDAECFDAMLTPDDRRMLALRRATRTCITVEEDRADGPEARPDGGVRLAPCIQLGSFNAADAAAEEEMLAWYADWRMPALRQAPGCIGIRKMVSVAGWAKHLVLYEFTSLEARSRYPAYLRQFAPEMAAWNESATERLTHAPGSPSVARRAWPPEGGQPGAAR